MAAATSQRLSRAHGAATSPVCSLIVSSIARESHSAVAAGRQPVQPDYTGPESNINM